MITAAYHETRGFMLLSSKRPFPRRAGGLLLMVAALLVGVYLLLAPRLWIPVRHCEITVNGLASRRAVLYRGPAEQLAIPLGDEHGERIYVIRLPAREVIAPNTSDFHDFGVALVSRPTTPRGMLLGRSAKAEITPNLVVGAHRLSFRGLYGESIEVASEGVFKP